jgi:hypothetical protein
LKEIGIKNLPESSSRATQTITIEFQVPFFNKFVHETVKYQKSESALPFSILEKKTIAFNGISTQCESHASV